MIYLDEFGAKYKNLHKFASFFGRGNEHPGSIRIESMQGISWSHSKCSLASRGHWPNCKWKLLLLKNSKSTSFVQKFNSVCPKRYNSFQGDPSRLYPSFLH